MDGEQYLRRLLQERLTGVRAREPGATDLFYELKGAAGALVAADLIDPWRANGILDEWHRTLVAEGFERRAGVGFGFHGVAQPVEPARESEPAEYEPAKVIKADPLDVNITEVDGVRLVADAFIRFTHWFDLRIAFVDGTTTARVELLQRMTRREWKWLIHDSSGTTYREKEGHGGLGAYTLRFRPALRNDAHKLTLTVTEDSHRVVRVSFPCP